MLTVSFARKLREQISVNGLSGPLIVLHLHPLTQLELNLGLLSMPILTSLGEEIRSEALVRNIRHVSKFLHLAAAESCQRLNFKKLS